MNASEQIDKIISGLSDWRGPAFARIRRIIREADPEVTEEIKWRGAPVYRQSKNNTTATTKPRGSRGKKSNC